MISTQLSDYEHHYPLLSLLGVFVAWKALIVLIVLASPGVGYDTSTSLLSWGRTVGPVASDTPSSMQTKWLKFVRWDALYFTHLAEQGHVFEQEWAFGMGLSTVVSWIAKGNFDHEDIDPQLTIPYRIP